jgi:hypothetical protein
LPLGLAAGVCSLAIATACADCLTPPSGLVSWWRAEGNAKDQAGSHPGYLYGGAGFTIGEVGVAFSFDGIGGHVRVQNAPDLQFGGGLTLEAWILPIVGSRVQTIMSKWDAIAGINQRSISFVLDSTNRLELGISRDGTDTTVIPVASTSVLPLNQWTHVAGTYDGVTVSVYVNGQLQNSAAYSGAQPIFPGADDFAIGGNVGGLPPGQLLSPFAGLIDEATTYGRALSAAEIQAIYNAGSAGKCAPPPPPVILVEPGDQAVHATSNATFTVVAAEAPPLSYQWNSNTVRVVDATNSSFTITNVQLSDSGSYFSVTITNLAGTTNSRNALLTVYPAPSTHYVDANGANPIPPFASWATAATNIQDAVDVTLHGDVVLVTNGVYATGGRAVFGSMTNRVVVDRSVTVRSINGPVYTTIQGYQLPGTTNGDGAIRCVYLTNGATLSGFTLTNGATRSAGDYQREQSGGGLWSEPGALTSKCIVAGNAANVSGGGSYGGAFNDCSLNANSPNGADGCTLSNCTLNANSGPGAGNCTLVSCSLTGNFGGGAYYSTLNNCSLVANSGGGAESSVLTGCIVSGNWAGYGGGVSDCLLTNCLLAGNYATNAGGAAYAGLLVNCTLTGNSAGGFGGGGYGFDSFHIHANCMLYNSIIYSNFAPVSPDCECTQYDCCTPDPSPLSANILTNAPLFVDPVAGNFRLQPGSPCINNGNNADIGTATDLDANPRIAHGTVDIGAYEYQGPGSVISYAWLQQYGLPTDGSADYLDSDGDGMNNWQEWVAGTDPTNPASALKMISAVRTATGVSVTWQSVYPIKYFLERSTNLLASPAFTLVATNMPGWFDTTSFIDLTAPPVTQLFYRVGVGN